MKVVVIGHPEAVQGFSLAGVHGRIATTGEEANQALDEVLKNPDIGIVLITEELSTLIQARVDQLKFHCAAPLVIEIPGPQGMSPDRPSLKDLVRNAIGIKI
jgi:V/A-type H+-transporting ATPase subunit F